MQNHHVKKMVSIIVPVYNEEDSIDVFLTKINSVLMNEPYQFEIIFINDGSQDMTYQSILAARKNDSRIKIVDLSRNFGKESALAAGFMFAIGDAVIPMDVDLQDTPSSIPIFLRKWEEGYEMVIGVRTNRDSDSKFKRLSANLFYRVFNITCAAKIAPNAGDFRLLDRKIVNVLNALPERNRFTKGLYAWTGFRQYQIPVVRKSRAVGKTKWNAWKLWNFALDGITGFSTFPLRIWSYLGVVLAFMGFVYALYLVFRTLLWGSDMPGYPSLMVVLLCLGGMILISLGVMGEYLGRIFVECKQRPLYIVRCAEGFNTFVVKSCPNCGHPMPEKVKSDEC